MFGKPNQAVEKAVLEQEILEREARIAALEAERKAETVVSMAAKRLSGHRTKLQKSRRRIANSSRRKNRK